MCKEYRWDTNKADFEIKSISNTTKADFEFKSIGWQWSAVYFMGVFIWTEENDERDYIGETDEKEPLRQFIIKQADKILKDLNMKMGAF